MDENASTLPPEGDYIYGFLCIVLGLSAISCNTMAILMFALRRSKISPAEYFLLNLMVTSLLFILVSTPMVAISSLHHRWMFGHIGAVIHGFLCYSFGILNILSIFTVALFRYLNTCWPHLGHLHNRRAATVYMVVSYAYALFWSVPPLLGWGSYGLEPHKVSSSLEWTSTRFSDRTYLVSAVIFILVLPLLGMLVFYCRIVRVSARSTRAISKHGGVMVVKLRRRDRKLNQLVVLCLTGYVISWLPYTIVSLHATFVGAYELPVYMVAVVTLFAKLSGLTNPLCYILVSSRYRRELTEMCSKFLGLSSSKLPERSARTTSFTDGTSVRRSRLLRSFKERRYGRRRSTEASASHQSQQLDPQYLDSLTALETVSPPTVMRETQV